MKKLIFYACGLFICFTVYSASFAQKVYSPGFLVRLSGDTVQGFFNLQPGKNYCRELIFRESPSSPAQTYRPADIRSYFVSNFGYYVSEAISYHKSNKEAHRILEQARQNNEDSSQVIIKDTVFLALKVSGIASLYIYFDSNANPYYFIKKNEGDLMELYESVKYSEWRYGGLSKAGIRMDKKYLGILHLIFNDCPDLRAKIDLTGFTEGELTKITRKYNKCRQPD